MQAKNNINPERYNLTGQVLSLLPRDSLVRISQTSGSLEVYMVINFKTREISRGACKLIRKHMLIYMKKMLIVRNEKDGREN